MCSMSSMSPETNLALFCPSPRAHGVPTKQQEAKAPASASPFDTCDHNVGIVNFMFNNPNISNFEFHLEGKKIYAVRNILAFTSSFMAGKFEGDWQYKSSVVIDDYLYQTYHNYLRYLYTDRLDISVDEALNLSVLAMDYGEEVLKQRCIDIIKASRQNIDLCKTLNVC